MIATVVTATHMAPGAFATLGLIAWIVAMHKGRHGLRWFVLGILGGPFALIAALVLPSLR